MPVSNIFGLQAAQNKGKASLQTVGTGLEDDLVDPVGLPTSPFSNLTPPNANQGLVQAPKVNPAQLAAGFQFSGEFDAANRGLAQRESDLGLNRTNTLAQIASRYQDSIAKSEQQNEKGRRKLFESLADRGALGSGASLEVATEYDTGFQDYLNDLSKARAYDISAAESGYASGLNQIGREREGLAAKQQQAEEARRLEEARVRAEAERLAREEEQRRQQIQQLIEAQEQARLMAEQAAQEAAAARLAYQAPQPVYIGGGGGGGYDYGGGGGGYSEPAPQAPAPVADAVVMPAFNNGVTRQAVEGWVRKNVDPYVQGTALNKVIEVLSQAGPRGVSRSDLAWLIGQYPVNQPSANRPHNAGRGVRVY